MNKYDLYDLIADPDYYLTFSDTIKQNVCFGVRSNIRRNIEFPIERDVGLNVRNAIQESMTHE